MRILAIITIALIAALLVAGQVEEIGRALDSFQQHSTMRNA